MIQVKAGDYLRRRLVAPPDRFSRSPSLPLLVWIAISGTFAIHLFVPVLSQAAEDLHVAPHQIQLAITAYLIGLSLGQLCLGPLSDRYGRRPVLVTGLALYVAGSLGTALAPSLTILVVARVLQAIGGCAGLVLGRAITRDTTDSEGAARRIAILAAAMGLGPGLAPLVGTELSILFGWRGMFLALAAVSALLLALTVMTLPETHLSRGSMHVKLYAMIWLRLLRRGIFLRTCLGGAFATTSIFAFVANAGFIFRGRFDCSVQMVGVLYFIVLVCLTAGSLLAGVFAGRITHRTIVIATTSVMTLSSGLLLGAEWAGAMTVTPYVLLIMLLVGSIGVCGPFALTAAINADPAAIGAASGLYGCLQMATGAAVVSVLGVIPATPIVATSIMLLACSFAALCCFGYPNRRRSGPSPLG